MPPAPHPRRFDPQAGLAGIERALVVIAHPDDAEFGAGGTIALLTGHGVDVQYLVMTDGASGSPDPDMTRKLLAATRHLEQTAACNILGVSEVMWGGYTDGYLEPTAEARRIVAATIRSVRPHLVITMDPRMRINMRGYVNHPDHRAVGDLVLHSINPAASTRLWDPSLLAEGLEVHDTDHLWLIGFGEGNDRVDITDTFGVKCEALRCHASQLGDWDPETEMAAWAAAAGAEIGATHAESFTMLDLRR